MLYNTSHEKFRLAAGAVLISVGLFSCSEDFEVSAPYKNVTFVYGLMNMADTAHYIRIQKAFLDENKNAVEMAKISDSSFYNDLDVVVREVINGNVIKNIPLSKVDLNLEGYPKDTGSFFNSPNYAYKFKTVLQGGNAKYRLVITSPSLGFKDSSEISILDTTGSFPSITATQELVVPKSIPIILLILLNIFFDFVLRISQSMCH